MELNSLRQKRLTTIDNFKLEDINKSQKEMLEVLKKEAKTNNFKILLNNKFVEG